MNSNGVYITQSANFNQITQLLVKESRGSQSQEELSYTLNANFNIVNRWENGQRGFYWEDFLLLAQYKKWDVARALNQTVHTEFITPPEAHQVVRHLASESALVLLQKSFSLQKIKRLCAGKSKLLFSDLLLMLEIVYGRSLRFIRFFINDTAQSALSPYFDNHYRYYELLKSNPQFSLLHLFLSLEVYKNTPEQSDSLTSQHLKLSLEETCKGLETLEEVGFIIKQDKHYVMNKDFIDSGVGGKGLSLLLSNHFRKKICSLSEKNQPDNPDRNPTSAYLIFAANPELDEKVFELCKKFYTDVKNLVADNKNCNSTHIRYIGIDLLLPLKDKTNSSDS